MKSWDQLTDREHILKGFLASLGLSPAEVERRAAQASYLVGSGGPQDLVHWLKHLHAQGWSMFDENGYLKQPQTFATARNRGITPYIYDKAVSPGEAAERYRQDLAHKAAAAEAARRSAEAEAQQQPGSVQTTGGAPTRHEVAQATSDYQGTPGRSYPMVPVRHDYPVWQARSSAPEMREMTPEEQGYYDAFTLLGLDVPMSVIDGRKLTSAAREYLDAELELARLSTERKQLWEDAKAGPTQKQWGDMIGAGKTALLLPASPIMAVKGLADGLTQANYEERHGLDYAEAILDGIGSSVGGHVYRSWKDEVEKGYDAWRRGENPDFNPAALFFKRLGEIADAPNAFGWWPDMEENDRITNEILAAIARRDEARLALKKERGESSRWDEFWHGIENDTSRM
ncbi:MAG: hypothetical protein JXA57_15275 [Armatimonadetes bacterium]|nr:hypothetical protein [Armatimonadota bacterium]